MMAALQRKNVVLADLLASVPAEFAAVPVTGIALDSRWLRPGDVFIAVAGHRSDGRDYIAEAAAAGAVAVIAEAPCDVTRWSLPVVAVPGLGEQLSEIAGRFQGHPSRAMNLIGVTGTNGKTSTVLLAAQLLEKLQHPCGVIGTLGNGRYGNLSGTLNTTPDALTIQSLLREWVDAGARWAAMEVSSHALVQHRVKALHYRAAVFTNLSQDHLDYHGDMASYAAAKAALFSHPDLGLAVLNLDDAFSAELRRGMAAGTDVLTYSTGNKKADVWTRDIEHDHAGMRALVTTPWGEFSLSTQLIGDFNLSNLLAVITVLGGCGIALDAIADGVSSLQPIPGRMERLLAADGLTAVVDYAHTPDALEKALNSLRPHCAGHLWCVFGCGGDRDAGKRPQMGAVAAQFADRVVVTSDNPRSEDAGAIARAIVAGMPAAPEKVDIDRDAAIRYAIAQAAPDDIVLIAGKGHEAYQEFNGQRLPFSDVRIARLALARRRAS